ncbi:hypothetical protein FHS46_000165 [Variibacter gotjawalensis]|nr:hypothetical protein [Variibacter gotjawalensis]
MLSDIRKRSYFWSPDVVRLRLTYPSYGFDETRL